MDKCKKCGGTSFNVFATTSIDFELEDGVLTPVEEENLGYNDVYTCNNCDAEYQAKDFKEIL